MPLVYGLGNSTCESQRAAMMLAERIGGVIDSHTSLTHGPTKIAGQLVGKLTCTLGEVKNRADLVVYWGTNPVETHPRHFTKFTLTPKGKFVPGGRKDRTMVLVDVRETLSARASDVFLQIRPGADLEVLTALRALVKGRAVDRGLVEATGVDRRSARGSGRADETRPLRRVLLRQRPDHDPRQTRQCRRVC